MIPAARLKASFPRAAAMVEPHVDVLRKAVSFALIGVVNVAVDTTVFFIVYWYLTSHGGAQGLFEALAQWSGFGLDETAVLVTANLAGWLVAVSGSYVMNSYITFAAESGRRLNWRAYSKFVASGVLGAVANTAALLAASAIMPVLPAKGCSILAAFAVNFIMSHFVVFRPQRAAPESAPEIIATE